MFKQFINKIFKKNIKIYPLDIQRKIHFKVLLVGTQFSGKTTLITTYTQNEVKQYEPTIYIDLKFKTVQQDDIQFKLHLHDTCGTETFWQSSKIYFVRSTIVVILFDLSDITSFQYVSTWFDRIKQNGINQNSTVFIIGNKINLSKRQVSQKTAQALADSLGAQYRELSVCRELQVNGLFNELIQDVFDMTEHLNSEECYKLGIKIRNPRKILLKTRY